jgi:hypothetical protein
MRMCTYCPASHSDLPELARSLFAPAPEREKLLRFWIETS